MRTNNKKRIAAGILSLCLTLGAVTSTAFASDEPELGGEEESVVAYSEVTEITEATETTEAEQTEQVEQTESEAPAPEEESSNGGTPAETTETDVETEVTEESSDVSSEEDASDDSAEPEPSQEGETTPEATDTPESTEAPVETETPAADEENDASETLSENSSSSEVQTEATVEETDDSYSEETAEHEEYSLSNTTQTSRYSLPSLTEGVSDSLYLGQLGSRTCTLCAATMLIRSYIRLNGSNDWTEIGENMVRQSAWLDGSGLYGRFSYSYSGNYVHVTQKSFYSPSISQLKAVLDEHPEGIVLYCGNAPHAVFLIGYEGDTFYCADPANSRSGMKIRLDESWLATYYQGQSSILANVTHYWYIDSGYVDPDYYCEWEFDDGTLTISGVGPMDSKDEDGNMPWNEYLDEITSVVIEDGITSISDFAFADCSELETVTIPDSVTTIGASAFSRCDSLTAVEIPYGVTAIEQYTFFRCTALEVVNIPESVTDIERNAFCGCSSLIRVVVPDSVETISAAAFTLCESLEAVYVYNPDVVLDGVVVAGTAVIYGDTESTAAEYAETNGNNFVTLTAEDAEPVESIDGGIFQYEVFDIPMSWEDAEEFCEERGGTLAAIPHETMEETILSALEDCELSAYYIGVAYNDEEERWESPNGSAVVYSNIDPDTDITEYVEERDEEQVVAVIEAQEENSDSSSWTLTTSQNESVEPETLHYSQVGFICMYIEADE